MKNLCRLAVILFAALAISVAASPAAVKKNVFWIDLGGTASKHPNGVFFTANSGGHVKNVKWKNWGGAKAVGRGWFFDTSPSYPGKPNQNGPAKLVAWKPVKCTPEFGTKQDKEVRVYRHVKLNLSNGKGGREVADVGYAAGFLTCK